MSEYTPLHVYGQSLAEGVNASLANSNCLDHAKAVIAFYNQTIGAEADLQDADVQCGIVYDVRSYGTHERRSLHASNFLLAKTGDVHEVVGVDGYEGKAWKRSLTCMLPYVDWSSFDDTSVVYIQHGSHNVKSGKAQKPKVIVAHALRTLPESVQLMPESHRTVVLGQAIGTESIDEFASSDPILDKDKLPILLLERHWK